MAPEGCIWYRFPPIPGVLDLQGFDFVKKRELHNTLWTPGKEGRWFFLMNNKTPPFRISAEGPWFIWVLLTLDENPNQLLYTVSILVNQPVSRDKKLLFFSSSNGSFVRGIPPTGTWIQNKEQWGLPTYLLPTSYSCCCFCYYYYYYY